MHICIHLYYVYIITIKEETMNSNEIGERYMGVLEGGQGRNKCYNYCRISKIIFEMNVNEILYKTLAQA